MQAHKATLQTCVPSLHYTLTLMKSTFHILLLIDTYIAQDAVCIFAIVQCLQLTCTLQPCRVWRGQLSF